MATFSEDDCRIDDAFYKTLLAMQRRRAIQRSETGTLLLAATIALILAGVLIFVFAAPDAKVSTENEAAYIADLSKLRENKRALSIESQRPIETYSVVKRSLELIELLEKVHRNWEQVLASKNKLFLQDLRNAALFAADVAETYSTQTAKPATRTFVLKTSQGERQYSFGVKSQEIFLQLAESTNVHFTQLAAEIAKLRPLLSAPLPAGDELPQELLDQLKAAYMDADNTKRLAVLSSKAKDRFKVAEANYEASREDAIDVQARLEKFDSDIKEIETKLQAEKDKRNAILFMAWVPGLTVRVGSVVLLLFLTQILLATYRFTMSLSTYYDGIGDAIQMLQPGADQDKWYRMDHLKELTQVLVPGSVRIDPVVDPTEHITTLAKAWIARGGK